MKELGDAEVVVGGAIGEPGARTFYLRVQTGGRDRWFVLEKQQLQALGERCLEALRTLEEMPAAVSSGDLGDPDEVEFRVGDIGIGFDDETFTFELHPTDESQAGAVEFRADAGRVRGMAEDSLAAVAAGRPICPFCNLPKDAEGHVCPATNGHRRLRSE